MSPEDRERAIQDIIDAENKEAEKKRLAAEAKKRNEQLQQQQNAIFQNSRPPSQQTGNTQGGGWYFYNQSAISFGMSEFKRKWGDRQNEDNWRRSKKTSLAAINPDDDGNDPLADLSAQADSLRTLDSEKRREAYLKAI
ncbi:MAG: hypothetical protein HKN22_08860, partial [Bacteroidia bacterium]|nr:hypothetical protein [Bacteroidia bacterium]